MTVLRSGSASDVGRVRSVNQDRVLETANLFAVADGMGGHAGGEVASRMAMEALQVAFARRPSVEGLQQAIIEANTVVFEHSLDDSELRGMGTTLTAAALVGGSDGRDAVALANVGDSRAYVYSDGQITQITADHSVAEEKVRQGEITEAEAAVHPHRHILTRALGVSSDIEVDLWELKLRRGDRLLLCSDGLTNEVSVPEIAEVLGSVRDPEESARRLVKVANDHGGNDNITALVVDVLVDDGATNGATMVAPLSTEAPPVVVNAAPATVDVPLADEGNLDGAPSGGLAKAVAPALSVSPAAELARVRVSAGGRAKKESRRARRRRLGIPRRVTMRVIGFLLLVALVFGAAYGVVRWYATNNWYVTLQGNHLVVYQGQPGGLLWFNPKIVYRSKVTTGQIPQQRVGDLRSKVQESSLSAAKNYITSLQTEYAQQKALANEATTTTTSSTPTQTSPSTSTTTTTTSVP